MDNTERLIQRYLAQQATPAEVHELGAIAAREGTTVEELIVSDTFKAFNDHFETIEATEAEFDLRSFQSKKLSPTLPRVDQGTPRKREPKVIPIKPRLRWLPVAATLTALLLVSSFFYWINYNGVADTASITYKGRGFVILPDNSTVIMNDGSELAVSASFGESNRTVFLTGEALFDVQPDPAKPFIVRTENINTTVLGTKFNIKAKKDNVTITVVHGRVQVGDEQRMYGKISRDEQIEVDINTNNFIRRKVKAEEALAWQKDFLIFHNITFSQAVALIEKRFKVKVSITNDALKNCPVLLASFLNNESLDQIVTGLSGIQQARATVQDNNVIIEGGQGCD